MLTLVLRTTLLFCAVWGQITGQESAKQNGQQSQVVGQGSADQETQTECTNYRLSIGKYTNYFYTCCGELRINNPPMGTEEMVENWDCNPSRLSFAKLNETGKYNCNGHVGQATVRGICNARWGWLAADDCWAWSVCFQGACEKEANEPGSLSLLEGFCGDGRCDADEDTASCPGDCCPQENPDMCLMKNSTCTEACCSESTCCASATTTFFSNFWVIVFSVLGAVFLLVNICCCCCCYCFYRRCKGATRVKRHPSTVDRQDTTMTVLSV